MGTTPRPGKVARPGKPQRTKTRCKASGKAKWLTQLDALLAIAELRRGTPGHAYLCPDCRYWHITRRER